MNNPRGIGLQWFIKFLNKSHLENEEDKLIFPIIVNVKHLLFQNPQILSLKKVVSDSKKNQQV